jgi:hypothetical protein
MKNLDTQQILTYIPIVHVNEHTNIDPVMRNSINCVGFTQAFKRIVTILLI